MKKLLFFLVLFFFLFQINRKWPDKYIHLYLCDVGQGDAILISKGFFQILIDTGPDEKLLDCLNKNLAFWDKKIDVLVLTHFDDDHIGAFSTLIDFYQISYIFLPLMDFKNSETYLELKRHILSLIEQGTIVKEPFLGQQIAFSDSDHGYQAKYNSINPFLLTFLYPYQLSAVNYAQLEEINAFSWQETETKLSDKKMEKIASKMSENDRSIAALLQVGELSFLAMGDLKSTGEEALLESSLIGGVDVLKVGHHGAKSSSSMNFILEVRPETSLISVGKNNAFKHPHQSTLDKFNLLGTQVFRTDTLGTIELILDGNNYCLKNKKNN